MLNTNDRVLILEGNEPAFNLAAEEALLSLCNAGTGDFDPLVLFYVNSPAIVVGKFQNPWIECDVEWLLTQDIPVLRRVSGGGTVWHDFGNINYSFVVPRKDFDQASDLTILSSVLNGLGAQVSHNERGDLLLDGAKVSGNAMCYKNLAVLHHGTILIASDLERLRRALTVDIPSDYAIKSVGVKSRPSVVTSLGRITPERETETWLEMIATGLAGLIKTGVSRISANHLKEVFSNEDSLSRLDWAELSSKYKEWDWNFGHTPQFSVRAIEKGLSWSVNGGLVRTFASGTGDEYVLDPAPRFNGIKSLERLEMFGSAA